MSSDTLTDVQKRIQNMLLNPDEQFKKAVEQGQIEIPDWEKDLFAAAAEVDDTSSQDNKGINLWDAWNKPVDSPFISNSAGPMMFLGEKFGDGAAQVVSDGAEVVSDGAEAAKKTVDKTVNNFLPANIGKNLGLALYGIIAVAGIAVFVYILSLLKPLFEIGSNVSEK